MKTLFIDGGRKRDATTHPSPSHVGTAPSTSLPATESAADTHRELYRSHTRRLNKLHLPNPLPYLDVLSLQSRRLVSQTREQIAAHEATTLKKYPRRQAVHGDNDHEAAAAQQKLEDLLESVHLLLEPIQIPDLSHTAVFDTSTSQLQTQAASESNTLSTIRGGGGRDLKLSLSSVDKESEVKLFYPTGAKKVNMREYIKETLQRHLASQSYADLPQAALGFEGDSLLDIQSPDVKRLAASASEPALASSHTISSSLPTQSLRTGLKSSMKKESKASTPSPAKHKKPKFAASTSKSPTKTSSCGSPLLNPELTRQAKDIIAAIRANSSKINELMNS